MINLWASGILKGNYLIVHTRDKGSEYTMQRRFGVMVGAAALGFAGILVAGPSAAAAETAHMSSQAGGAFYVYEHDDFKGSSAVFTATDKNLANNSWAGEPGRILDNNISSMKNQTDRDIYMYDGGGSSKTACFGDRYVARKHSEDKDLTKNTNNPSFDNKASCIIFG
jgi:hypothetical protein